MIPVTEPLHAVQGQCITCHGRVWQVLLRSVMEGKVSRMWLKVDAIHSAGDDGDGVCGYHEHLCVTKWNPGIYSESA